MDPTTSKIRVTYSLVVCVVFLDQVSSFYRTDGYLKGHMVDWSLKMFDSFGDDVPAMFGASSSITIIRERKGVRDDVPDTDGTGLSALLSSDCSHASCVAARGTPECLALAADDETHVTKLVIRRTGAPATSWLLECRRFPRVLLPAPAGGTPGRRTLGDQGAERGRLATDLGTESPVQSPASEVTTSPNIKIPKIIDLQPPSPQISSSDSTEVKPITENPDLMETSTRSPDECHTLFNTDPHTFHVECCLKAGAGVALRDHRCHLRQLLEKTGDDSATTEDSDSSAAVPNPVEFEEDISELGKTLDILEDEKERNVSDSKDNVIIEEITGQKENWRHKYFVVLGFFLVFLAFFLIAIAILVVKLKKNKTVSPPASPGGAPGGLNLTQQRARGYSAIEDEDQDQDSAPLTPATQQAQAFQY